MPSLGIAPVPGGAPAIWSCGCRDGTGFMRLSGGGGVYLFWRLGFRQSSFSHITRVFPAPRPYASARPLVSWVEVGCQARCRPFGWSFSRQPPPEPAVRVSPPRAQISGGSRLVTVTFGVGCGGYGGRVRVDLVEEQFQGAGDAGRGGALEGDGDCGGGVGDGAGQAADDGLAGDGAVFVVVAEVGVEVAR